MTDGLPYIEEVKPVCFEAKSFVRLEDLAKFLNENPLFQLHSWDKEVKVHALLVKHDVVKIDKKTGLPWVEPIAVKEEKPAEEKEEKEEKPAEVKEEKPKPKKRARKNKTEKTEKGE